MAQEKKTGKPDKATKKRAPVATASAEETFALEYDEDRKIMRFAIIGAVILHVILFLIQVPEIVAEAGEIKKTKVYVVQQVRFKPPPPTQQQDIPKQRSKKVPIPDPTPDEPEPIRLPEEIDQPEIDMPDTDIIFGIPEGPPPAEPEGPIRVGGDVAPPVKITAPPPQYTEIARKARVQGVVIVEAIIDKQGNVTNVKILKSLPMGLDTAAADAVKKWRFEPATLNGKPVAVIYNLTVNFRLQ
ncbi:MAG: TonB family protein [Bacteroidia bacterium]|nr:TonB family protein [Bacteroidia bacterium]